MSELWANIPLELRERNQWYLAGADKAPRYEDGSLAAWKASPRPMGFEAACRAASSLNMGIGFVLDKDDPFTCIDLDVKDAPTAFQLEIVEKLNTYTERSSSRKGMHVWAKAKADTRKTTEVEIYSQERFIICTGNVFGDAKPLADRQELIRSLCDCLGGNESKVEADIELTYCSPNEDVAAHYEANDSPSGKVWRDEWQGEYSTRSEALHALVGWVGADCDSPSEAWSTLLLSPFMQTYGVEGERKAKYSLKKLSAEHEKWRQARASARQLIVGLQQRYEAVKATGMDPGATRLQMQAHTVAISTRDFAFTRVGDMLHHIKPIDWLVRGYLETDSLALLFGDPGCGKSFMAVDLSCCIATGKDWHGKATKQGAVFYIAGEGHNGLTRRFKAWEVINSGYPLTSAPLFISERSASLYDPAGARAVSEAVEALAAEHGHPCLIVVDTLARNSGGADENSTKDMNDFVANLDTYLKDRFHACVLIAHHTGHSDKSRARGSMALKGALDAEYQLQRGGDEFIRLSATKMKDAEPPDPLTFKLESVPLPFLDEYGNQVFGAVLNATDYVPPQKVGPETFGKNEVIALKALEELCKTKPPSCVWVTEWKDACKFESRQAFFKVKGSLQKKGIIQIDGAFVVHLAVQIPDSSSIGP